MRITKKITADDWATIRTALFVAGEWEKAIIDTYVGLTGDIATSEREHHRQRLNKFRDLQMRFLIERRGE
jgi:hypothetical protein